MADNKVINESQEILNNFRRFKAEAETWRKNLSEDIDFGLGLKQWSPDQVAVLESRGQAPLVIPIIGPQIELQKSMIISKNPKFTVVGVEDTDRRRANIFKRLLDYFWFSNHCDSVTDEVMGNVLTCGKGYYWIWYDQRGNKGKGTIRIDSVSPLFVIPDPSSRRKDEEDSSEKYLWRSIKVDDAKVKFPEYADQFDSQISHEHGPFYVGTNHSEEDIQIFDEAKDTERGFVDWIIELKKVSVKYYRVITPQSEQELTEEQFAALKQQIAQDPNGREMLSAMKIEEFFEDRIHMKHLIGTIKVWDEILLTGAYPLVAVPYEFLGNPYCMSLTRKLRGLQIEKNKRRSLMIAHATASTNFKLIIEKGSVSNKEDLEDDWARPGAIIEITPGANPPVPVGPSPLPNALYTLEELATNDSYYVGGTYPMSQGDSSSAPRTYSATLAMDEYGGRRVGNTARALYYALNIVGRVVLDYIQAYMTTPQKLRIVNPNNPSLDDQVTVVMGQKEPKDNTNEYTFYLEDATLGTYDVYVVSGSMAPISRYAELEMYKEFFGVGIIDDVEVLKKTDIFDAEGVLERKGRMMQMNQQMQSMQKSIEDLSKQNERLTSQVVQSKMATETATFQAELDKMKLSLQDQTNKKLLDLERAIDELQIAKQQVTKQAVPSKEAGKEI